MADEMTTSDPQKSKQPPTLPEMPSTPVEKQAVTPIREALKEALNEIDSPEKAEQVLHDLEVEAAGQTTGDVQQAQPSTDSTAQAAHQVKRAEEQAPEGHKAKTVLAETARAVTTAQGRDREVLSQAAQDVFNPEQRNQPSATGDDASGGAEVAPEQREYLREALFKRLRPLDALDAQLFLKVNGLPRTSALNRFFYTLTTIFTAGAAWYGLMGVIAALNRRVGIRVIRDTALPLLIASSIVEFPIKSYFRRKRPFIAIVQAIVIGRKPGTWSFPSGHSAVAFGGAWLLSKHFPRARGLLYTVAGMVAFSRVYLGSHYPGDVVVGSALGTLFAEVTHRALRRLGRRRANRDDSREDG